MNSIEQKFGFGVYVNRDINLDEPMADAGQSLWQKCMQCGSCAASCSDATGSSNLRRSIALLQRGLVDKANETVQNCLFCGKCAFVCPRGISTRHVIAAVTRARKPEPVDVK